MNNICNKCDSVKVLIISNESSYNKIINNIFLHKETNNIEFELITIEEVALSRLQHNNYDVLILQHGFLNNLCSIDLLKMSYAMCKPSIIIHTDFTKYLIDKFSFKLSYFYRNYIFSKFLVKHLYDPSFKHIGEVIFTTKQKTNHVNVNDIYNNIISLLKYNTIQLKNI